jgi:hypothetical protein
MTGDDRDFRDDELRNRFTALRLEEEAQAPEFVLLSPGAGRGRWRLQEKLVAAAVCVVAILAAVLLLRVVALKPELGKPVASLTEWRAPTAFLLETPGRELLRNVPELGVWHDYTKAPRRRQKHQQATKQVLP